MIKKVVSFTFIFLILLIFYQFLFNSVKNNHFIEYSIEKGNSFKIEENYIKKDESEFYLFKINNNDNNFIFEVDNKFNKQKKVIKDIYEIEQNGYYCIAPIYLNNKIYSYPSCVKDNVVYSYSAIKDVIDFSAYLENSVDEDREKYDKESSKTTEEGVILNKDYFDDEEVLLIYDYKNVSIHYKTYNRLLTFSTVDNYKNTYGILVGNYYLIPKLSNLPYFNIYYKYDIMLGSKDEITLPKEISKQTYINGVYDGKLYIFDKSNLSQYEIDVKNNTAIEVGNINQEGFIYRNGVVDKISVYDLNKENITFTENLADYSSIDYDNIYFGDKYIIYEKNGFYYKVYKNYLDNPIFLFKDNDIHFLMVKYGNIYYVKDDTIYKYNDYGSFPIAIKNEFKFNYDNIFDVYKD